MFASGAFLIAAIGIYGLNFLTAWSDENISGFRDKFSPYAIKFMKYPAIVFCIGVFLMAVVPKKEYMIMVAASEVGEMVVKSETIQSASTELGGLSKDAISLLRTYISVETEKLVSEQSATKESKNND